MPAKKSSKNKRIKTQVKSYSSNKSKGFKLGRTQLVVFLVIFAAIGSYFLFRAHAASNTSYNLTAPPVGIAASGTTGDGYWIASADGGVYSQGTATFHGSLGSTKLAAPIVGIAATHDYGGYWMVGSDGGLFAFGDAHSYNSLPGLKVSVNDVVGMAPTPSSGGYWMVGSDGGIFSFGNAGYHGSSHQINPSKPPGGSNSFAASNIVGMAATPDGGGYWMASSTGGIFAFGNAVFYNSLPGKKISVNNIVGIVSTADGKGYWLVGADGGVYAFGDAGFFGSMGGQHLNKPMVGMAATSDNKGYWLVAGDGGVFAFGDAMFEGRQAYNPPTASLKTSVSSITAGSGQSARLTWQTTNAQSAAITPTIGTVAVNNSVGDVVTPAQTTTYTLSVIGQNGSTISATVTVAVNRPTTPTPPTNPGQSGNGPAGQTPAQIAKTFLNAIAPICKQGNNHLLEICGGNVSTAAAANQEGAIIQKIMLEDSMGSGPSYQFVLNGGADWLDCINGNISACSRVRGAISTLPPF